MTNIDQNQRFIASEELSTFLFYLAFNSLDKRDQFDLFVEACKNNKPYSPKLELSTKTCEIIKAKNFVAMLKEKMNAQPQVLQEAVKAQEPVESKKETKVETEDRVDIESLFF